MVHLRIVWPRSRADAVLELLCGTDSVVNVIRLHERRAADPTAT